MDKRSFLEGIINQLNEVIHIYASSLDRYSMEQLKFKPNEESWSLGQVYDHLIHSALNVYFPAIRICLDLPETHACLRTEAGDEIFRLGDYPPIKAKFTHYPKNSSDKQSLYNGLQSVLERAIELLPIVSIVNQIQK